MARGSFASTLLLAALPPSCNGAEYWEQGLQTVRAANLTFQAFHEKVVKGFPMVVSGVFADGYWPKLLEEFQSCEALASSATFKDVEVKKEYADEGDNSQKWFTLANLPQPPSTAYYWAIKEAAQAGEQARASDPDSSKTWDERRLRHVAGLLSAKAPEFLVDSLPSMKASPEVWISGPKTGAKPHADGHAESTLSIQLAGRKRWRIAAPPERHGAHVMRLFGDGAVSKRGEWEPTHTVELSPGEMLVFPPGTLHETSNVGDECAISLTVQFDDPWPSTFYRRLLKRILLTPDLDSSWRVLNRFIERAIAGKPPKGKQEVAFRGSTEETKEILATWEEIQAMRKKIPKDVAKAAKKFGGTIEPEHLRYLPAPVRKKVEAWEASVFAEERQLATAKVSAEL
eukprot:TRINITY_DN123898_c0_g1_i1.p1 TRINITY_DN123898_c0_g1~~TRINITY_DN123898_c0_g1_i1.p1  ORF type:complete len:400 (-),score=93.44 TRINITY_DN123898_c0_g1_i1:543-1742(-)